MVDSDDMSSSSKPQGKVNLREAIDSTFNLTTSYCQPHINAYISNDITLLGWKRAFLSFHKLMHYELNRSAPGQSHLAVP